MSHVLRTKDFEPLKTLVAQICANRGQVRLLLGQPEMALEDCQKALQAWAGD